MLERIGPEFQCLKEKGWNSNVGKEKGQESNVRKGRAGIPMLKRIRPGKDRAEIPMLKRIRPGIQC